MPAELPYMTSNQNVPAILERIKSAATPLRFTHEFLKSSLGFGSSNDRAVIKVLKQLGFLDANSVPTSLYNQFRGQESGAAMATGLRAGWAPLFVSDERVYERTGPELIGIVKNVTGSGDAVARKIATTFKSLAEKADWNAPTTTEQEPDAETELQSGDDGGDQTYGPIVVEPQHGALRLHHDIHLHLPPTSDVGVYRAIFQAMKSELM